MCMGRSKYWCTHALLPNYYKPQNRNKILCDFVHTYGVPSTLPLFLNRIQHGFVYFVWTPWTLAIDMLLFVIDFMICWQFHSCATVTHTHNSLTSKWVLNCGHKIVHLTQDDVVLKTTTRKLYILIACDSMFFSHYFYFVIHSGKKQQNLSTNCYLFIFYVHTFRIDCHHTHRKSVVGPIDSWSLLIWSRPRAHTKQIATKEKKNLNKKQQQNLTCK